MRIRKFFHLFILILVAVFIGSCGVSNENSGGTNGSSTNTRTISGYVIDDPVVGAVVTAYLPDGTEIGNATTDRNGYFEIKIPDEIQEYLKKEIYDGEFDSNAIKLVAEKNGRSLEGLLSLTGDWNNVFITNDIDAFIRYLRVLGNEDENKIINYINSLKNGRIDEVDSPYKEFILALREEIKKYFMEGKEEPSKERIFELAKNHLSYDRLAADTDYIMYISSTRVIAGDKITLYLKDFAIVETTCPIDLEGNLIYTNSDYSGSCYVTISTPNGYRVLKIDVVKIEKNEIATASVQRKDTKVISTEDNNTELIIPAYSFESNETVNISIYKPTTDAEYSEGKPLIGIEVDKDVNFVLPITIKINYEAFNISNPTEYEWKIYDSKNKIYLSPDSIIVEEPYVYLSFTPKSFENEENASVIRSINRSSSGGKDYQILVKLKPSNLYPPLGKYTFNPEGKVNTQWYHNFGSARYFKNIWVGINHNGIDIQSGIDNEGIKFDLTEDPYLNENTPVYAMCDGKVIYVRTYTSERKKHQAAIGIRHRCGDKEILAYYGHLNQDSFQVRLNDEVKAGQFIAYLYNINTKEATKHLHLTISTEEPFKSYKCAMTLIRQEANYSIEPHYFDIYKDGMYYSATSIRECTTQGSINLREGEEEVNCRSGWGQLTCFYNNRPVYISPDLMENFNFINPQQFLEELYSGIKENTDTTDNIIPPEVEEIISEVLNETDVEEVNNPTSYSFDLSHLSIYSGEEFDKRYTFYVSESFKNAQCEFYVPRHNTENDKLIIDENATTEVKFDGKWYTMYRLKLYAPGKIYDNVSALSISDPNTYTVTIKCQREVTNPIFWVVPNTIDIKPVVNDKITSNNFLEQSEKGILYPLLRISPIYFPAGQENPTAGNLISFNESSYDFPVNGNALELNMGDTLIVPLPYAGTYNIFVHVPKNYLQYVDQLEIYLKNGLLQRKLTILKDWGELTPYRVWYPLKFEDENSETLFGSSFLLTGAEYIHIVNKGDVPIPIDAFRIFPIERTEMDYKVKTQAIIKDINNLSKLVVSVVNTSTSEVKKFLFNLFGSNNSRDVSNEERLNIEMPLSEKGTYQIIYSVDNPLYQPVIQYLSINDDSPTEIQLPQVVIAPINQFKNITVRIVNALNGEPISDANVQVTYGGDNYNATVNDFSGHTDSEGKILFENLQYGVYTIKVTKENYKDAIYTLKIDDTTSDIVDLTLSPILPEGEIRIVLTWGETPSDLDSHLVKVKDGTIQYHVYYSNMHPTDEADLDHDDTTSFGPETITIHNLDTNATYKYYVHDYSTYSGDTSTALANSGATVKVYWGDRTYTYYVPNLPGTAWKVFEIVNGTLIPCTGDDCVFGVSSETDSQFGTRSTGVTFSTFEQEIFKRLPVKH